MKPIHRDEVFVAGGLPTVTYIQREDQDVERMLARALAAPNQVVSVAGPTKTGKTVLCKKVLGERDYVWIDGGKVKSSDEFWKIVCAELNIPHEKSITADKEREIQIGGSLPFVITASGSHLSSKGRTLSFALDSMGKALEFMTSERFVLVIDDFHYIASDIRTDIMRNLKGAVFNGLKVVLLSVTHRVFDAIRAESELTGRFITVSLPQWTTQDLEQIPLKGFKALNTDYPPLLIENLCDEAQENPFLMQKFCWEICFDNNIETAKPQVQSVAMPNIRLMCERLATDYGLPTYQQLVVGPQSRKIREKRPLRGGGEIDIYEVVLLAIARTGPKSVIKYDELRNEIGNLLADRVPQKHEITAALKHLTKISKDIGAETAIDWNEQAREIAVIDPYLRFYLKWQVRKKLGESQVQS